MNFRNALCVDTRCNGPGGCYHRGKANVFCDFSTEQKLCKMLNLSWKPDLELDTLLAQLHDKICQIPQETNNLSLTAGEKENGPTSS